MICDCLKCITCNECSVCEPQSGCPDCNSTKSWETLHRCHCGALHAGIISPFMCPVCAAKAWASPEPVTKKKKPRGVR